MVTTHEMEDAEALADRVLIMAEGKILSEGTIHEIKFEHGSGYQLKLMCTPRMSVGRLMTQINHIVPNARLRVILYVKIYKMFTGPYRLIRTKLK